MFDMFGMVYYSRIALGRNKHFFRFCFASSLRKFAVCCCCRFVGCSVCFIYYRLFNHAAGIKTGTFVSAHKHKNKQSTNYGVNITFHNFLRLWLWPKTFFLCFQKENSYWHIQHILLIKEKRQILKFFPTLSFSLAAITCHCVHATKDKQIFIFVLRWWRCHTKVLAKWISTFNLKRLPYVILWPFSVCEWWNCVRSFSFHLNFLQFHSHFSELFCRWRSVLNEIIQQKYGFDPETTSLTLFTLCDCSYV